ncbi:MAG TPA: NAD(P)H-dependent glycerol-3-phosphate dehydrogenase [Fimbriimonadaceae bacterium]|jgi:glycerol-3-phosphate dehydrogenase (NAD(P)+)
MKVTVLGAGSWGTALAILLARNGHDVVLYGRNHEDVEIMHRIRENLHYLPAFAIPSNVLVTEDAAKGEGSDCWVIAVPSGAVRHVLSAVTDKNAVILVAAKGLEIGSAKTLHDVCKEVLPEATVGVLSGPNLAIEIVRGVPTAAVVAFENQDSAEMVRSIFMCHSFRIYLSQDVVGIELAGALKNVLAIAAGMSDGLGFGDNTKGALLARGLHEMTCLGLALGARVETFMGIAGVGDLFATAASTLSRNYRVGKAVGEGMKLREAIESIGQVAEGVPTSESAVVLTRRHNIQAPIFEAIDNVVRERLKPMEGVARLMERMPKSEGFF